MKYVEGDDHRWIAFASAALAGLVRPSEDGEVMDTDDACDVASELADGMLADFRQRFPPEKKSARGRTKVFVKPKEEEDDDDD